MQAARQQCEKGRMFWFATEDGDIFAVADSGRGWLHTVDESPPDKPGFDWAREAIPSVLELVGNGTAKEQGYDGQYEVLENGYRFTDIDGTWVLLDQGEPDEPIETPIIAPPVLIFLRKPERVTFPSGRQLDMALVVDALPGEGGTKRIIRATGYKVKVEEKVVTILGESEDVLNAEDAKVFDDYWNLTGIELPLVDN